MPCVGAELGAYGLREQPQVVRDEQGERPQPVSGHSSGCGADHPTGDLKA
jgi:hypothetical protein